MKKNTQKIILIFGLIIIGLLGIYKLASLFSPGSYPYAEIYELNYPEEKIIEAIKQFKIGHPEMVVPRVTIKNSGSFDLSESEGRKDSSKWYLIYFYYPKENQIILTWTRPSRNGKTAFAFVSLNNGLDIGHWKEVNRDFKDSENKECKKVFEERILDPIKSLLKNEL